MSSIVYDEKAEDFILKTDVSIQTVKTVICEKWKNDAKLECWSAKDIGDGIGFSSYICRLSLTWASNDKQNPLPKSVIVKIPTISKLRLVFGDDEAGKQRLKEIALQMYKVHNTEVAVFQMFDGCADAPCKMPKLIGCRALTKPDGLEQNEPAYIIMEDMSAHAKQLTLFNTETLNDSQCREVMCQLASLHAWGVINQSQVKEAINNPLCLFDYAEKTFEGSASNFDNFPKQLAENELFKSVFAQSDLSKVECFRPKLENIRETEKMNLKFDIPDTMCHGDVHTGNMLFEVDKAGKASGSLAAMVDWQIVFIGNPIIDVARALNFPIAADKRTAKYQTELLQVYYDAYDKRLKDAGLPGAQFTRQQLSDCFWEVHYSKLRETVPGVAGIVVSIAEGKMPGIDHPEDAARRFLENIRAMYDEVVDHMKE